jgi:hypothetical protein
MSKIIQGALIIILSGYILLSVSCNPGPCYDDTDTFLVATFYNYATLKPTAPKTITLYGLDMDSMIYNITASLQPAKIQLNVEADTSSFIIKINNITDTIIFRYSSYPHFVSKECGYTFYHDLDTVPYFTNNIIDSISLTKSKITTRNEENIRIFY